MPSHASPSATHRMRSITAFTLVSFVTGDTATIAPRRASTDQRLWTRLDTQGAGHARLDKQGPEMCMNTGVLGRAAGIALSVATVVARLALATAPARSAA